VIDIPEGISLSGRVHIFEERHVKLSVVIATRNRASTLPACLNAIAAAFAQAAPLEAEIVIVDNGSTDNTTETIKAWSAANAVSLQLHHEPKPGVSRARNRALRATRGEVIAFMDDDCRMSKEYVSDLLRHDAADTGLVLRGGRIELGDPADIELTTNTSPTRQQWSLGQNSARHDVLRGQINGCNMVMRRALIERIGFFDENLGPGCSIVAGEDTDYTWRAYLSGATLEYVPDMVVFHHHGRRTSAAGKKMMQGYLVGAGALYAKYFLEHPNFCRSFYWDCKSAFREILTGTNTCSPQFDFSHKDRVTCSVRGAVKYFLRRRA
jgi:glycosyltransferase involved in cell wall biosynthesis